MSEQPDTRPLPQSTLRPDTFNRHLGNVYPALAMLAGLQLDVFTPLADGPLTVEQLAARLKVQARKLRPLMHALLQVMSRDDAQATVRHCAAALLCGGGLYVVGRALDDTRLSPLDAVAANVMFLNIYDDGQAYTEGEYRSWLAAAGLVDIHRQELAGGYSILHGRKI